MKYAGRTVLSDCRRYRYSLSREWEAQPAYVLWLMLNPSTADAMNNDATIRRCIRYSKDWGFGGLMVGNLYAYRATDPTQLFTVPDPVGPENNEAILEMAIRAQLIVCAWGQRGPQPERRRNVLRHLDVPEFRQVHALRINGNGEPGHPLRLPLGARPLLWDTEKQTHGAGS